MITPGKLLVGFLFLFVAANLSAAENPNIILVFIDDMGWGDLSCFGNTEAETPNIDALAKEGLRFHGFYVNSPICSPSRVAISTGQYPHRRRITSYLARREFNTNRGVAQWLDPKAPMLARFLKNAGYATGHFGKWHMGGQRDVTDAPPITAYGFDESLTNFEGMGPKLLPLTEKPMKNGKIKKGRIWDKAVVLGGPVKWTPRCQITGGFVERAVDFIDRAAKADKPFYINLWPDDVHTPLFPSVKNWRKTNRGLYRAVIEEMDAQFGTLFDRIKNDPKLRDNTIILLCSDNGPEVGCGSGGPFKGSKATLFEAGVRSPLVVWGPGFIDQAKRGTVNKDSVFCAMDIAPSLLSLVGVKADTPFDGVDLADTLIGKSTASRPAPIFFRRPPDCKEHRGQTNLPDFAVRDGKWKFLCDYDGGRPMLFDIIADPSESKNLASQNPELVERLTEAIMEWNAGMPKDAGDPDYQ